MSFKLGDTYHSGSEINYTEELSENLETKIATDQGKTSVGTKAAS